MDKFLALVWREAVEWRLVLVGGLIVGWMPWVATWLPAFERHTPEELREGVAIFSTGLFLFGFLVVLGSSILGRELSEGRLRFYFSRPFSAGTLWAAKLSAAFLLLLATFVLLLLPSADLVSGPFLELLTSERDPALPLLAPTPDYYQAYSWQSLPPRLSPVLRFLGASWALLLALAAVHCFSSMVRLRSAWILLDLLGLVVVFGLALWTGEHLMREQALSPLVWLERALLLLVPMVFLVAGWNQLRQGRGDPARSHRSLSLTLWPLLVVLFLGVLGWAHWLTRDTVADLERVTFVETAPAGPWMMVGGTSYGRAGKSTAFLQNTSTGQGRRLGGLDATAWQFAFSGDGKRAVWGQCDSLKIVQCALWALDLSVAELAPHATGIVLEHALAKLSLNYDGTRLALYQHGNLAIYELPSGGLVHAVRTNEVRASLFLDNGRVRFYVAEETADAKFHLAIRELDVERGTVVTTGTLPDSITGYHAHHSLAADTVLYWSQSPPRFAIAQGSTGEDLVVYQPRPSLAALLADGTSVLAFREEETLELVVRSPTGEALHSRLEKGVDDVVFGGELSAGRMVIGLKRPGSGELSSDLQGLGLEPLVDWTSFILDSSTGDFSALSRGLVPLQQTRFFQRLQPRTPESVLGRLFQAGRQTVLFWDPDTGEARRLFEPPSGGR